MPDARVQAAIDNWAPRMVTNGVDLGDFNRTTAKVERWEEWIDAWCELGEMHLGLAREAEEAGRLRTAGEAFIRAAVAFHFAKYVWVLDGERNTEVTLRARDAQRDGHRLLDPAAERIEAPLEGSRVVANLRRPRGEGAVPLVILIPGLDSTKEEFFSLENVFLDRGLAVASLDGPGQGEGGFELPLRHDYEVAVGALLDELERSGGEPVPSLSAGEYEGSRASVDLDRVGVAGVSLGGYYAPRTAAFEPRIKAAAGVCGPWNFGEIWDHIPGLTRDSFTYYSRSADQEAGREAALELGLDGVADQIEQPLLIIAGKLDRLIPWEQTKRIADAAPNGEFVVYDEGNHVCNNVAYRYRPLVADWLAERL
ncbi:alpha/beta hydrolase [Thermoleophilia bacterium SCSIO 60948]|nr:alpha/beta hydrolase [Thermoleophilia bacterium SCSIO 60948]